MEEPEENRGAYVRNDTRNMTSCRTWVEKHTCGEDERIEGVHGDDRGGWNSKVLVSVCHGGIHGMSSIQNTRLSITLFFLREKLPFINCEGSIKNTKHWSRIGLPPNSPEEEMQECWINFRAHPEFASCKWRHHGPRPLREEMLVDGWW